MEKQQLEYNKKTNDEILSKLWKEWLKKTAKYPRLRNYGNWENWVLEDNFEITSSVLGIGKWSKELGLTRRNPVTGKVESTEDHFEWYENHVKENTKFYP